MADKGHPLGPVFQEQPVDTEFFEEQPDRTVTLHCCARANPPASYRWMLNSTEIEYSERFSLQGGNLVISDAERSLHSGQYQCEASNVAGSVLSNKATLHFIWTMVTRVYTKTCDAHVRTRTLLSVAPMWLADSFSAPVDVCWEML
ncbi:unnamed protein product [Lampetra planeri]